MRPSQRRASGRRLAALTAGLAVFASVSGCGLLGGSDEDDSGNAQVEKSKVNVSIQGTIDLAAFHLARERGYFSDEGLQVNPIKVDSADKGFNKLNSGEVDIIYSGYTGFFDQQAAGTMDLKLIADASSAAPKSNAVMVPKNSPLEEPKDLEGKTVGVTPEGTLADILTKAWAEANDVDLDKVNWKPGGFSTSQKGLGKDIDAAFFPDPFIAMNQKELGAESRWDPMTGPLKDLPMAGYGTTAEFADENPKTVAAFQRAMVKASNEAETADRTEVIDPLLVEHVGLPEDLAPMTTLLTFESSLDPERIQRVPDLMVDRGALENNIDVKDMIIPPDTGEDDSAK
ncbi:MULTISPECIES: ABC transporter substrate-binding protein [Prauserella salsuginis group]|uniref:NitT/TauT family transport system substrate-binding protein n=2 Tax=Prauserella salsuginis group TaxID=2893672 RepID=A0A839XPM6_9PSEU|nr:MULTISPECIES: ABC transporter substrate-binding protein [Prauserella salsuginis group]MBB3663444.1 NitT/TauT family transport system substrate-binding protein [Prauserella sediminis]MCR3720736.1 NitT/TauT family transport system substrate-binding protein [Prauserella flava]MCR3735183.1 NitT/TauT family transport system substrate-binding protein [Prauserella salsuginis]